ncbi:MAG: hypothetical protein AUJ92_10250 [Armatimonadetes bacterium CG2_30_59_28]|nr:hypothetical protein [Armatimonadota bacterium]OIO94394.1 MAG: hypothetical protein AUJ92_10250 [Armatimonadetes bacterium CG2_30_59_28]PIU60774.1 MAG: hypothetical protein COS85_22690 [Armatimonadetes bacterium CG07_land_8_20_14_0_80_59_28]PJB66487.1 MAG: hypothetical protein CO095_13065 [Armatimonadetes bacterium CG_4_9_14_3_um_filter_58_7]
MKWIKAVTALGILACSAVSSADVVLVRESLTSAPESGAPTPREAVSITAGRFEDQKATLVRGGSIAWKVPEYEGECFVEVWVKPEGWDALTKQEVIFARFVAGEQEYQLLKPTDRGEIQLRLGDSVLQVYPIYNWTDREWMKKDARNYWHYVNVGFSMDRVALTIDGFAGRSIVGHKPGGRLEVVELVGQPAAAFSTLHVVNAPFPKPDDLRARYRSLYRGQPNLEKNTVTVPWLDRAPNLDGRFDPQEWQRAATMAGFSRLRATGMSGDPIIAHVGYDQRYLYMTIRTPYQGKLNARHWKQFDMPLWGEESYEIFLHPPYTGVPDFCQLVGNPYGDQADLKMLNLKWNGKWDWSATVTDSEWIAELRADFAGIGTPPPGNSAIWTMNVVNTEANAGWCRTQRYNDSDSFGVMRFDRDAPVVRPGQFEIAKDSVTVPVQLLGSKRPCSLGLTLEVYGKADVLPAIVDARQLTLSPGKSEQLSLVVKRSGLPEGKAVLRIAEGSTTLFFHTVDFPVAAPQVRQGIPEELALADADKPAAAPAATPSTDEEKAYQRKWSAEELGKTLLDNSKWINNKLGISGEVPKPWTGIEVIGEWGNGVTGATNPQTGRSPNTPTAHSPHYPITPLPSHPVTLRCWGREYVYNNSLLPVQIRSGGEELLAAPARFVLAQKRKLIAFGNARVEVHKVNNGLVRVRSVARSGNFQLELLTDYEFDGMGKVEMTLSCPDTADFVDGFRVEFPLAESRCTLYHLTSSRSGHAPSSASDRLPATGLNLDAFRELVWLGDNERGFCWFAESMEDWQIGDEKRIQKISASRAGGRVFSIKLADRSFRVERPWKLVFGIQATPTRPRPEHFREIANMDSVAWCWFWGDGAYYPWQSNVDKAKAQIAGARKDGKEVMPCSSLNFYGLYRFYESLFGKVPDPGLIVPEAMLWGPLWSVQTTPTSLPTIPERHTASGNWYGKRFQPHGLQGLCVASPWQDFYVWKLNELIQQTGLGALYLDQPLFPCSNAHHGCGYVDYKGEWTPRAPIFAMREMIKRIYRLFYDAHGKTFIRWHCSNQIIVPAMSFVDIFWDGENYGSGPHKVSEFYSKILSADRLQAEHTGLQFGFSPSILPEFEDRYAPSPASIQDMMGLMMVHDVSVWDGHTSHTGYPRQLENLRLSHDLPNKKVIHYWDGDRRVQVGPATVKFILHFSKEKSLLILFNWSDQPELADVRLDTRALGLSDGVSVQDAVTKAVVASDACHFQVPILPRDLRMLTISPP